MATLSAAALEPALLEPWDALPQAGGLDFRDVAAGSARKARPVIGRQRGCKQDRGGRRGQRARVEGRLLRAPIPDAGLLQDTLRVLEALEVAAEPLVDECEPPPAVMCELEFGPRSKEWTKLLDGFMRNHAWRVFEELGHDCVLSAVYPEEDVQQRFLQACGELSHAVSVGYHGTKRVNIEGIARRGLLVPSAKSGIKVANGSAHGVGVYTARLGKAILSKGFSDSGALFICAICDTSMPLSEEDRLFVPSATHVMKSHEFPRRPRIGKLNVLQESDEVRHVGDAMVIYEHRCVVPLFLACPPLAGVPRRGYEPAQQVGRRRVAAPDESVFAAGVHFAAPGQAQIGRTVWLTPLPVSPTPAMKRLKRELVRRQRQKELRKPCSRLCDLDD